MKQYLLLAASAFLLQGCQTSKEDIKEQPLKMIEQIDFSHVKSMITFGHPDSVNMSRRPCLSVSIK